MDTATARHALEGLDFAQDVAGGGSLEHQVLLVLNIICPKVHSVHSIHSPRLFPHLSYNLPVILQLDPPVPTETA